MKEIVIFGGGFAGSYLAKNLENKFHVTLIDSKNYFEFTPGILRTIVEPFHMKKIQLLHRHYLKKAKIVTGKATSVDSRFVFIGKKKIPFNYLVICSGSSYYFPFRESNIVLASRAKHLSNQHKRLFYAKKVLIIGGGLVGIELAGEILDRYSDKKIILVHANDRLLERNNQKSIDYADNYLKKKGVHIIKGEKIIGSRRKVYFTDNGRKIGADIAFLCKGITPNYHFFKRHFKHALNERNQIKVNNHLQVSRYSHIFAAGDVNDIIEEKTAQNAERQAKVILKNILSIEAGLPLFFYKTKKTPLVISLGRYNGILEYKSFVLAGIIPAFLKWFIEKKEMWTRKLF